MKITKAKIIEIATSAPGCNHAIVDHPDHGRLYACEMKRLEGDNFGFWDQGYIAQILPTDTLDDISAVDESTGLSIFDRITSGYDSQRPLLEWPGYMIKAMMDAALVAQS